ncbi:uncharacterized protein N7459_009637 [Penicillium hispanicum]|uniref:uncharacterized protein n=1 Tax=Penicillium hispanicum TaxID=1080232 RepID=UPI00254004F1|nr:uncharacterized protein N7459_009637 [Penicillium hispanicum]KAJ5570207.1 hypothetical protein N7459_009637 [Penicillium hispanicum]
MAMPRLPFLYPNFMRAAWACEPTTYRSLRPPFPHRNFHTSRRRAQEAYQRRYGPAVEPNLPPPSRPNDRKLAQDVEGAPSEKEGDATVEQSTSPDQSSSPVVPPDSHNDTAEAAASSMPELVAADSTKSNKSTEAERPQERHENEAESPSSDNIPVSSTYSSNDVGEEMSQMPPYASHSAFDDVYHMPSPSTYLTPTGPSSSHDKPPHLSPAPYVHHFDTYSLVQDLSQSGFTNEHSITIMKAVRSILQNNIDFAKQSLTSKSDVENESYLFKAACSELQQSLQTARNSEVQRQRASRTQLEHEADILGQRLNQELAGMKDDIKGMFNDHKMSTREQQRTIDTSVQELNYKITVSLNSDGKSEIEGLRWILTRRAALTVATCAFMIIVFLKYASTRKVHEPPQKVVKEIEKPAKEITTETRVIRDVGSPADIPSTPEAHLGESLG